MTVVPVRRITAVNIRRRIATVVAAFAVFAIAVMIWAPTVGSTPISLARAFDRSIPWDDNVDAQIFFVARLPRVLAGRAGRRHAGRGRRGAAGAAAQPARHAVHARRLGRRRRSARCSP